MDWLISTAAAQAQSGASGQSGALMQIPFLILMFVVFYFLLIRPQTKRAKEHRALIAALEVGAEVVTNGGILGKVTQLGLAGGTARLRPLDNVRFEVLFETTLWGTLKELREVVALVENGRLAPLPVEFAPLEQIDDVYRRVKRGEIDGRVVITP